MTEKVSRLSINGSEVYVKQVGQGVSVKETFSREAILVVHGGPVMDHSYLLPHLEVLARDYQLVFYDQRASGRSSVEIDSATMSLDGLVEDIELIRKELGLGKVNLLAHSWGGLLAMKYAIAHPEGLKKLILSGSTAPSAADRTRETRLINEAVTEQDNLERNAILTSGALQSDDPRDAIESLLKLAFRTQMYDTANLAKLDLYVPIDYMTRSGIYNLLSTEIVSYDLYDDLAKVKCPTLLIYGETEPAPSLYTDKILNAIPEVSLKVIQRSGHFPFIEQPGLFKKEVLNFLKEK